MNITRESIWDFLLSLHSQEDCPRSPNKMEMQNGKWTADYSLRLCWLCWMLWLGSERKKKMCQDEMQHNELHVLCNYEPTALQNEESLCKELFFLPSSWHYYDNMFISDLVASAVFSSKKKFDNSSSMEPTRQNSYLNKEIYRKKPGLTWSTLWTQRP